MIANVSMAFDSIPTQLIQGPLVFRCHRITLGNLQWAGFQMEGQHVGKITPLSPQATFLAYQTRMLLQMRAQLTTTARVGLSKQLSMLRQSLLIPVMSPSSNVVQSLAVIGFAICSALRVGSVATRQRPA